jgi:mono/diheme cytochrome c family protein
MRERPKSEQQQAGRLSRGLFVFLLGGLCILVSACHSPPAGEAEGAGWPGVLIEADPEQIAAGRQVAERECAQCHAVDTTSRSANPAAPPLREVLLMNDADNLAYRFIEAMRVGHDDMPLFDFDVRSADALIAYIASISR